MKIYQNYTVSELSELIINSKQKLSLDDCYTYSEFISKQHYENFPVGSIVVPKELRKYFYSIYSFSRLADDIADEDFISDRKLKLEILNKLEQSVENILNSDNINNPILISLKDTIIKFKLPLSPFLKLISAFKQDVNFKQPQNWDEVLLYCDNSANPIGELVLRLFDEYNQQNKLLSDNICTGLQLINFWQDMSRDFKIGRCYIPIEVLERQNIKFSQNELIGDLDKLDLVLSDIYEFTDSIYDQGKNLTTHIKTKRLRLELLAIISGGDKVLSKSKRLKNKILLIRPKVTKFEFLIILIKIFL